MRFIYSTLSLPPSSLIPQATMSARWTEEEKEALFLVVTEHAHRNKSGKVCVNWGEVAVALGPSRTSHALSSHFHADHPEGVEVKDNAFLPSEVR